MLARRLHESGADRILEDVPRDREEGLVIAKHVIVKTPLPQWSFVLLFEGEGGTLLRLVDEPAYVGVFAASFGEKMKVIGHEAVHDFHVEFASCSQNLLEHEIDHIAGCEMRDAFCSAEREGTTLKANIERRIQTRSL
jgi:hypothetical protein